MRPFIAESWESFQYIQKSESEIKAELRNEGKYMLKRSLGPFAWTLLVLFVAGFVVSYSRETGSTPSRAGANTSSDGLDRTVLPIAEPKRQTYKELDARNAKAPERWEVKAPEGAPNVVVVLIDDMGFGASAAFGGPINMPNLDKIAATGIKYNRFHTTSLCSPTRVALLTGYNHHSNNAGSIMET